MRKVWKRGAAIALAAVMCAGALSGCGKKSEGITAFSFNGKKVDGDFANFVLRYEQSSLDDIYAYYASMMQQDIWSMDDGQGLGVTTWDNFKSQAGETIEKLLLVEEHAKDYDVSLTDDEKKAITDAASKFIADNDKDALASMSATQEVVERYLTLSTIQAKVEEAMSADVDTNVSDEEAAQRTVGYIRYTPSTEAQTEAQSESEMAQTEADAENTVETEPEMKAQTEPETKAQTEPETKAETEPETKAQTEPETKAETESETESEEKETVKKDAKSDAKADAKSDTKADAKISTNTKESESETEKTKSGKVATQKQAKTKAADDQTGQAQTEPAQAVTEAENLIEEESETEDPAMAEAKVKYREMAEEELEALKNGDLDFETAVSQVNEESDPGVTASTFTFGKDDSSPDAAIIEATNDLGDDTLVEELIEVNDSWYILYVQKAFDEEATQNKKEEIVEERKAEKVDEIYADWMADEKFDIDSEKLAKILKDRSYTAPVSDETEASNQTEADQGVLMTEETELHLEVTYETEIAVETESET